MSQLSRREFLAASAASIAAVSCPAFAIEPVQRTGKQEFRVSLAAYSFNGLFKAGKIDLFQFIDYCASLKLEGTELTSYYFKEPVAPEYLAEVKKRTQSAGLTISGGAIRNDFCQKAGPKLDADMASCNAWVDHYAALDCKVIRVFAGNVPKGDSKEETLKRCIANLEIACDYAGTKGVILGLENHGGLTAFATDMLDILKGVKSKWLAVNFDSGNFKGPDAWNELAAIAPYAVNVQYKINPKYPEYMKTTRPEYITRVAKILKDSGYSGWVALEYESPEDPYTQIPGYLDEIKAAMNG